MATILNLRYFEIKHCGYYTNARSNNVFENIPATLESLKNWAKDKTIEETGLNDIAFLIDIQHKDDLWLISLWNKVDSKTSNEITSINMNSKFGQTDSETISAPKGKSFGYASYFLICPSKRFYTTIMPEHSQLAGRDNFENYMKNFLLIDPQYTDFQEDGLTSTEQVQISLTSPNFQFPNELTGTPMPKFSGKLQKTPSEKEYVIKNFTQITQIKNRCAVKVTEQQTARGILETWLPKIFGNTQLFAPTKNIRLNSTVSANFETREDLEKWVADWEQNFGHENNDCGFKLQGDSKTYWLSGNIINTKIETGLRANGGVFNAKSLLATISSHKDRIFSDFRQSQND